MPDRHRCCCFTGHRDISLPDKKAAFDKLSQLISSLAEEGITEYYAGGAVGFDMIASICVLNLKNTLPQLRLNIALPCKDHSAKWSRADREMLERILQKADSVVYVSEEYSRQCMQKRNMYMADRSSVCVCYMNAQVGGTYNTVSYAKRKGLRIINIA